MTDADRPRDPEVGSLAEEAARLLGAVSGWARDLDLGDHDGGEVHDKHVASGSPECRWCPVCRTVRSARGLSPEVRTHLATATTALAQAALAFLATVPEARSAAGPEESTGRVEPIDLDEDWPDDGTDE